MTDKELSMKLREDARKIGLCDKWYGEWEDETKMDKLILMFKKGLDFCIQHRWPSKSFIKQHFKQDYLRRNGILVDDARSYPLRDGDRRQVYLKEFVLLGNSNATLRYSFRPHICTVWACDNSSVKVDVKYGAYVMVHLFDKASADVKTDLVSSSCVIRHSSECKVTKDGVVNLRNEFHYLE